MAPATPLAAAQQALYAQTAAQRAAAELLLRERRQALKACGQGAQGLLTAS